MPQKNRASIAVICSATIAASVLLACWRSRRFRWSCGPPRAGKSQAHYRQSDGADQNSLRHIERNQRQVGCKIGPRRCRPLGNCGL